MILTEKEALQLTMELWRWLKKNPGKAKYNWPKWKHNGGKYYEIDNHCFLCEYVSMKTPDDYQYFLDCYSFCPLIDIWKKTEDKNLAYKNLAYDESVNPCTKAKSPYALWYLTKKAQYAKIIADACEKKLKEMEEK